MNYNLRNKCIEKAREMKKNHTLKVRNVKKVLKFVPYQTNLSVYEIDYNKLYSEGKRYILFDLDNTLCPYDRLVISDDELALLNKLKEIGFKVALISNNNKKRLIEYINGNDILYTYYALKPRTFGYKRIYKKFNKPNKDKIVTIGDQMMTDCLGGNKFGVDVIIVKSIKRSNEKWYTVINRKRSKKILKNIRLIDEVTYHEIKRVDDK